MYGQTFKSIRKSKNMTLKEAAGETISVSQLSRFENGKSVIPVDLFYEILTNINTTSIEFNYFKGNPRTKQLGHRFKLIEKYVNKNEDEKLIELKRTIQKEYPSSYSWNQFLIYFIDSVLGVSRGEELDTKQPVLNYLMQVEEWGEMELRLYIIFGFVFEIETTYFLMHTALKRSKMYQAVPTTAKLLHTILSNNFSTFLFYGYLDYAEETIELFEKEYSENVDALTPHIDFIFNKGLLSFKKNQPEKAREYCEKAISTCSLFRQKESERHYKERYKNWKINFDSGSDFRELTVKLGLFDGAYDDIDA